MEVEKNLEGKKKFEKPELQVVEMKLAGVNCASCPSHSSCDFECCGCAFDE